MTAQTTMVTRTPTKTRTPPANSIVGTARFAKIAMAELRRTHMANATNISHPLGTNSGCERRYKETAMEPTMPVRLT
jgi:hypothetical protein